MAAVIVEYHELRRTGWVLESYTHNTCKATFNFAFICVCRTCQSLSQNCQQLRQLNLESCAAITDFSLISLRLTSYQYEYQYCILLTDSGLSFILLERLLLLLLMAINFNWFSQTLMASVSEWKPISNNPSLILVDPRYKINEAYYRNVMPLQQLLPTICQISQLPSFNTFEACEPVKPRTASTPLWSCLVL